MGLSPAMSVMIEKMLTVLPHFNMAQMLQGESTPQQILALKAYMGSEDASLKFYLFAFAGVMCGLRGHQSMEGSLFMDQANANSVLTGIRCLRQLRRATAVEIYWGYISARAQQLGLPA